LPYAFLVILVFIIPYITLEPWFSKLCPAGTLEAGIPQVLLQPALRAQIGWLYFLKLAILAVFLVWMVFMKRPFCRYVCPLGAIWSPFNRVSMVQLDVEQEGCVQCGQCREVCPVDISVYDAPNTDQCIRCLACVEACPHHVVGIKESNKEAAAN
jgi:polyferredoxin